MGNASNAWNRGTLALFTALKKQCKEEKIAI